jgi:hypothetical protein
VHEAQRRLRQQRAHQPHLGDRGDVEMGDSRIPQDLQQLGEGFAFTAYIDLPGNFSAKKRAARAAACGRLQITGSSGARARTTALASG